MKATKPDLIDQTTHLWRHRTGGEISCEDVKEMINNVAGFFQVLLDWDLRSSNGNGPVKPSISGHGSGRTATKNENW